MVHKDDGIRVTAGFTVVVLEPVGPNITTMYSLTAYRAGLNSMLVSCCIDTTNCQDTVTFLNVTPGILISNASGSC